MTFADIDQVQEEYEVSLVTSVQVLLAIVDPVTSYSSYLKLGRERLEAKFEVLERSYIH